MLLMPIFYIISLKFVFLRWKIIIYIFFDCHNIHVASHPRFQKTYAAVKKYYFWPILKRDVKDHVDRCWLCETNKVEQVNHPELLQPLSVPNK